MNAKYYYIRMERVNRIVLIALITIAIAIVYNGIFWLFYTFVSNRI